MISIWKLWLLIFIFFVAYSRNVPSTSAGGGLSPQMVLPASQIGRTRVPDVNTWGHPNVPSHGSKGITTSYQYFSIYGGSVCGTIRPPAGREMISPLIA